MSPEFATLAPLEPLMDKCVHCGFCLATCPSYLLLGQEMASPRGRIYLMRAGVEGRVAMSETFAGHFDTCLGCMACETACPSGVRYAPLVEHTRAAIEQPSRASVRRTGCSACALFRVLPYPARLRLLRLAARRRPLRPPFPAASRRCCRCGCANLLTLAPEAPSGRAEVAEFTPARGDAAAERRPGDRVRPARVLRRRNAATARVLAAEGCDVVRAGRPRDAAARSRSTPDATRTRARSRVS